jgi:hypothetical protein
LFEMELVRNGRVQRIYKLVKKCSCGEHEEIVYPKLYEGYDCIYMNGCHVRMSEYSRYEKSLRGMWDSFTLELGEMFGRIC